MHQLVLYTLLGFSVCSGHFSVHNNQHQRPQNNIFPQGPRSSKLPSLPMGAARALPSHPPSSPLSNSMVDLQNYYNQLITRRNQIQINSRSSRLGLRPSVSAPQGRPLRVSPASSRDDSDRRSVRRNNIVGFRPETVFATQVQLVAVPVMAPQGRLSQAPSRDDVPSVDSPSFSKQYKTVTPVSSIRAAAHDLDCDSIADLRNLDFSVHRPISCDDEKCPYGRHCNTVQGHGFCCPKSVSEWDIESRAQVYFF